MGRASVDASSESHLGAESWVAEGARAEAASHRSSHNGSYWSELRHTKDAMRIVRRGGSDGVEALRALRPESPWPDKLFKWEHRTIPVRDEHQLSVHQIIELRAQYVADRVADMLPEEQDRWRNLQGMRLAEERRKANTEIHGMDRPAARRGQSIRNNHNVYGMLAVKTLFGRGFLNPSNPGKFEHLADTLNNYDTLRQARDKLEQKVETVASRFINRPIMLGASAVRSAYRLVTGVVSWPVMKVYLWSLDRFAITGREVQKARRLALGVQMGLLVLSASFSAYRFFKWGHQSSGSNSALYADSTGSHNTPPNTSDQLIVPDQPDSGSKPPPAETIHFSDAATTTAKGEGWIRQLTQMNIRYSPEFMDKMGPILERKGYAYRYFDQDTNSWSWGMNLKNIDYDTLKQMYMAAQQDGLVTVPLPTGT